MVCSSWIQYIWGIFILDSGTIMKWGKNKRARVRECMSKNWTPRNQPSIFSDLNPPLVTLIVAAVTTNNGFLRKQLLQDKREPEKLRHLLPNPTVWAYQAYFLNVFYKFSTWLRWSCHLFARTRSFVGNGSRPRRYPPNQKRIHGSFLPSRKRRIMVKLLTNRKKQNFLLFPRHRSHVKM